MFKIKIIKAFLFFLLVFIISPVFSLAAFNREINYQGKLMTTGEQPVTDGDYNMTFRLCSDSNCATVLWTEVREGVNKVPIKNGLFSVLLGSVTNLDSVDFNQDI